MITLHHLNNSRSQRIIWLLEELGVDYQIQRYERDPKTNLAPAALKQIHPLGKSPLITDGDRVVAESGLIIEYLAEHHAPSLLGVGDQRLDVKYWLHYSEGSLMPLMMMKLVFDKVKTAPMPFFIKPIARAIADKAMKAYAGPNLINNLQYLEQQLALGTGRGDEYFCGAALSAADFQMIFPLEAIVAADREGSAQRYPSIVAYVERIHALPAYQQALARRGKLRLRLITEAVLDNERVRTDDHRDCRA